MEVVCLGDDSADSDEEFQSPQEESPGHVSWSTWSSGTVAEVVKKTSESSHHVCGTFETLPIPERF